MFEKINTIMGKIEEISTKEASLFLSKLKRYGQNNLNSFSDDTDIYLKTYPELAKTTKKLVDLIIELLRHRINNGCLNSKQLETIKKVLDIIEEQFQKIMEKGYGLYEKIPKEVVGIKIMPYFPEVEQLGFTVNKNFYISSGYFYFGENKEKFKETHKQSNQFKTLLDGFFNDTNNLTEIININLLNVTCVKLARISELLKSDKKNESEVTEALFNIVHDVLLSTTYTNKTSYVNGTSYDRGEIIKRILSIIFKDLEDDYVLRVMLKLKDLLKERKKVVSSKNVLLHIFIDKISDFLEKKDFSKQDYYYYYSINQLLFFSLEVLSNEKNKKSDVAKKILKKWLDVSLLLENCLNKKKIFKRLYMYDRNFSEVLFKLLLGININDKKNKEIVGQIKKLLDMKFGLNKIVNTKDPITIEKMNIKKSIDRFLYILKNKYGKYKWILFNEEECSKYINQNLLTQTNIKKLNKNKKLNDFYGKDGSLLRVESIIISSITDFLNEKSKDDKNKTKESLTKKDIRSFPKFLKTRIEEKIDRQIQDALGRLNVKQESLVLQMAKVIAAGDEKIRKKGLEFLGWMRTVYKIKGALIYGFSEKYSEIMHSNNIEMQKDINEWLKKQELFKSIEKKYKGRNKESYFDMLEWEKKSSIEDGKHKKKKLIKKSFLKKVMDFQSNSLGVKKNKIDKNIKYVSTHLIAFDNKNKINNIDVQVLKYNELKTNKAKIKLVFDYLKTKKQDIFWFKLLLEKINNKEIKFNIVKNMKNLACFYEDDKGVNIDIDIDVFEADNFYLLLSEMVHELLHFIDKKDNVVEQEELVEKRNYYILACLLSGKKEWESIINAYTQVDPNYQEDSKFVTGNKTGISYVEIYKYIGDVVKYKINSIKELFKSNKKINDIKDELINIVGDVIIKEKEKITLNDIFDDFAESA